VWFAALLGGGVAGMEVFDVGQLAMQGTPERIVPGRKEVPEGLEFDQRGSVEFVCASDQAIWVHVLHARHLNPRSRLLPQFPVPGRVSGEMSAHRGDPAASAVAADGSSNDIGMMRRKAGKTPMIIASRSAWWRIESGSRRRNSTFQRDGVVTFGSAHPPGPLYTGPTDRPIIRKMLAAGESVTASPEHVAP